jgi:hypothetical protein
MNFVKWLLRRISKSLIGTGKWQWVQDYRRLIMFDKPMSLLATFGCGLVWFLASGTACILFLPDRDSIGLAFQCILLSIPMFYIYNWLAALYEIYDAERMATWDRLKEQ